MWSQGIFMLLAFLESAQDDTGVASESCAFSSKLTLEHEYLVRKELWPKTYLDFASAWLNC